MSMDERYKTFIQVSKTGAWEYFIDSGNLWFSDEYFTMLGMNSEDFMPYSKDSLNSCWIDLLHPEDRKEAVDNFSTYLSQNSILYENYFRIRTSDNSYLWVLSRGMKVYRNDTPFKVIGTHINITDLKLLEQKNFSMEKKLIELQKREQLGTLVSWVSHDFRNILMGILNYASLIKSRVLKDEKLSMFAEQISRAGKRGIDLTSQILLFSRPQSSDYKFQKPDGTINEIKAFLEPLLPPSVSMHIENIKDAPIWCNPARLYQVLLNLCTNAIQSMNNTKGFLVIRTSVLNLQEGFTDGSVSLKKGDYLILKILDTGNGVTQEFRDRIFDSYFSTKEDDKGTGIGLSIVSSILKQHNAGISIHSYHNAGSTFNIYFPLTKDAEDVYAENTGGTLYVMSDDDYLKRTLKVMNFSCRFVSSSKDLNEAEMGMGLIIDLKNDDKRIDALMEAAGRRGIKVIFYSEIIIKKYYRPDAAFIYKPFGLWDLNEALKQ